MHFKKAHLLRLLALATCLTLANAAHAQGSFMGFSSLAAEGQSGTYSASTLTLDLDNVVTGPTQGTFTNVPQFSDVIADTTTIMGLSTSPTAVSVNNFLQFSSTDPVLGTAGTSPANRFAFNLASLTDTQFGGYGYFLGTGTLVDTLGVYAPTPGTVTVAFSGVNNYSITIQAVPEPTTVGLIAMGSIGGLLLRRRKV